MPGLYNEREYDMSGTIVGIVEKERVINGSKIKQGDLLLGFKSSGLHTNGYSLARKILFPKFSPNESAIDLSGSIGDELLKVHKSYLNLINALTSKDIVTGLSHITGGGIVGNTMRIVPKNMNLQIDWTAWEVPAIFELIKKTGDVSDKEMRHVFNLGIGLIAIVPKEKGDEARTIAESLGEETIFMGEVV
jgi:phosphoribosylformylglycinamidine cyclo-ligase